MAQGILLNYIVQGLSISPETSLDEIIRFKNCHRNELGRFKDGLAELTKNYDDSYTTIDSIQREIKDIYENRFLPAYEDLQAALKGFNIKWLRNSILNAFTITAGTTGVSKALSGIPVGHALYAGIGISAIVSVVSYNVEKKDRLRKNPNSYLLSINREW